jgi:serine/threonine-protein kinase HipA
MLEQKEAAQIIEQVRATVKDWRKVASELQIPHKILNPYYSRWDNL